MAPPHGQGAIEVRGGGPEDEAGRERGQPLPSSALLPYRRQEGKRHNRDRHERTSGDEIGWNREDLRERPEVETHDQADERRDQPWMTAGDARDDGGQNQHGLGDRYERELPLNIRHDGRRYRRRRSLRNPPSTRQEDRSNDKRADGSPDPPQRRWEGSAPDPPPDGAEYGHEQDAGLLIKHELVGWSPRMLPH